MRYLRSIAAVAAMLTASVLQATLVAPLATSILSSSSVSLCAVLVAAVALVDGPATGMAFGFTAGLLADLGSSHPAGVLALAWTCLGVVCGMASTGRSVREDVLTAATAATVAGVGASVVLAVVHTGGATVGSALRDAVPSWFAMVLLAWALVPVTRACLRNEALRAQHPVINDVRVVQRG